MALSTSVSVTGTNSLNNYATHCYDHRTRCRHDFASRAIPKATSGTLFALMNLGIVCNYRARWLQSSSIYVDKGESEYKFREADSLYRMRRYDEALVLLEELDLAHPSARRIQYPLARTLARLERSPEAIELLGRIVTHSDYESARLLKSKLEGYTASAPKIDISHFDEDNISSMAFESAVPPSLPDESPRSTTFYWILGSGLVIVFAVLIVGYATIGSEFLEWQTALSEQPDTIPPVPVGSMVFHIVFGLSLGFIAGCAGAYGALAAVKALPYSNFDQNLKDVALYNVFGVLLCVIPIIGWIALLIILKKHYELRIGQLSVVVFVYSAIGSAIAFGLAFTIGLLAGLL